MKKLTIAVALLTGLGLTACVPSENVKTEASTSDTVENAKTSMPPPNVSSALLDVVVMNHRSEKNTVRDQYRKPAETLEFFGIKATDTVVEILPGSGYYTEILAPYLKDSGQFIGAHYAITDGDETYKSKSRISYNKMLVDGKAVYGDAYRVVDFDLDTSPSQPAIADMVLTFRSLHGIQQKEQMGEAFKNFNEMLKTGGKLGVVQHRAIEGSDSVKMAKNGYVSESLVIATAEENGFMLEKSSIMHHNAKDTRDYVEGVWVLPPSLALGDVDKEKYLAIGESDRMTLLFIKK